MRSGESGDYVDSKSRVDQSTTYRDRLISRNIYRSSPTEGPGEEPINNVVIVIRYLAAASTTVEPDVKMNDGGNDPIYGELVLIATTNRQTDAIPFPGRKRHAKPRVVSSTFYTVLNRIE
ncbi:hypothetical protein G5I_11746 [Acromyrmex echinatior]|uniref:Uncharacterized protein n=1 Tax=Acromyrmex echinatior TaxID=103372 RepID=F4X0G7_ACREC|nr:hypothetical protein G5I_11746 [Acromyrmex echinatior]